jgi:hypothetical protein
LQREIRNQEQALKKAADFVEEVGVDAALEAVRTNQFDKMVEAAIYGSIIGELERQKENAPDIEAYRKLLDKQVEVEVELSEKSEGYGAFIGILPKIYEKGEIPYDYTAQVKKFTKEFGEAPSEEILAKFKEAEARYKAAEEKIWQLEKERDEALAKEAVSNISEDIERKKKKTPPRSVLKELAARVRSKSFSRPGIFSAASPASLAWDGAVEVVATALDAGGSVEVAIRKGLEYIRKTDWYKGLKKAQQTEAEKEFAKEFAHFDIEQAEVVNGEVKVPHSLIRYYVEEGMTDIDEIAGAILKDLKDENPDVTVRQIRDAITRYGQKVNPNKDEIRGQINKLKSIGKMMSRLEDIQRGIDREKNPTRKRELNEKRENLAKQIKKARQEMGFEAAEKAEAYKVRTKKQIEELERRIREGDFSKKTRAVNVKFDEEALKLYGEKERAKEAYDVEFERELLRNRTKTQKNIDLFWDVWGLPKSLKSTFDMSAPFRQGIIDVLTNNPVKTARTFKFMFQSTFDSLNKLNNAEEFYKKWITEVKASKDWPLMKASGLFLAMDNAKLTAREEAFTTSLLKETPILEKPLTYKGKKIFPGLKIASKSELAYNSFLNHLRVTQFREAVEALQDGGYTFESDPEQYKAVAKFIGIATGRANLGSLESAAEILNRGFFSPRFMASRFQFLNPVYYYLMPPAARRIAVTKALKFAAVATSLLAMAALYYNNDDDDETEVETNPLGDDFGKLKIGKTKVDFLGGVMGYVKFLAQVFSLHKKDKQSGEIVKLGSKYGSADWIKTIASFFAGKAAPVPGLGIQYALAQEDEEGRLMTPYGEEFTAKKVLADLTVPLYISDYKKILAEHSGLTSAALIGSSFFGVGVNIPNEKKPTVAQQARTILNPEEEPRKRAKEIIEAGIQTGDANAVEAGMQKLLDTYERQSEKRKAAKEIAREAVDEGKITQKIGLEPRYLDEFFDIYNTGTTRAGSSAFSRRELGKIRELAENRELTEAIMQRYKAEYEQSEKVLEFLKSTSILPPGEIGKMKPKWMKVYEKKMLNN